MGGALGDRLVAALRDMGMDDSAIEAVCERLEVGDTPALIAAADALPERFVMEGEVSTRLYNLLGTHRLHPYRAIQLLSRDELERLSGYGKGALDELFPYLFRERIELRGAEPIAVRAIELYGSVLDMPMPTVLSLVFQRPEYTRQGYVDIRNALEALNVHTVHELLALLAKRVSLRGVSDVERARLCEWLSANIFPR